MAYVYSHSRLDTKEIFYIGIGSDSIYKRANWKWNRGNIWHNIVSKTNFVVDIIHDNITFEEAKKIEVELILAYGRIDKRTGTLANMTDGGEGVLGYIASKETRKKLSDSAKITKNRKGKKASPKTLEKMRIASTGRTNKYKGIPLKEETKRKLSESLKGRIHSKEWIEKRRISNLGVTRNNKTYTHIASGQTFIGAKSMGEFLGISQSTLYRLLKNTNQIKITKK